jgi:hypothetical protein
MHDLPKLSQIIDSCYTIFVRQICEPRENVLQVIVQEAAVNHEPVSVQVGEAVIKNLKRIESTESSRIFQLTWDKYIAYSVRNESFVTLDDSEIVTSGRLLRIYSKSTFLEYVSRATFANQEHPGPYSHYQICSENHIVDVVSTEEPGISVLLPSQWKM